MNIETLLERMGKFAAPGQTIYLVGGSVRDQLMDRPIHDLDLAVTGNSRTVSLALANQLKGAFYPLDEERGTYRVILPADVDGALVLDIASLRGQTIEADMRARDFSINAMALDLSHPNQIIDPCKGRADIDEKVLRACTETSVLDDPVRALRAIRFAFGFGWRIEEGTQAQINASAALISRISAERVRDELFRILEGPAASQALDAMDQAGLLAVVLPELQPLKNMAQSPPHIYTGWEHTLQVAACLDTIWKGLVSGAVTDQPDQALYARKRLGEFQPWFAERADEPVHLGRSRKALLMFAALYHDCAKPLTRSLDPDGRIRFFNHDEEGARIVAHRARSLALSNPEVDWLETAVRGHMRIHHLADTGHLPSPKSVYRFFRDTQPVGIDLCLLSLADTWATYGPGLPAERWDAELSVCEVLSRGLWERSTQVVSPPRLISGADLIREFGLSPGPQIGRILEAVREGQAAGEIVTPADALDLAQQMLNGV